MAEKPWKGFIRKEPLSNRILRLVGAAFIGMAAVVTVATLCFPWAVDSILANYAYYTRPERYGNVSADDARDFTTSIFQSRLFEANVNLGGTDYADDAERIIADVNATCGFVRANHSMDDVFCVSNAIVKSFKLNKSSVYDYDHDGNRVCRDHAISYVYLMRKFGIQARFVLTNAHVLAMVRVSPGIWMFNDPTNGGFYNLDINDFIYANLG